MEKDTTKLYSDEERLDFWMYLITHTDESEYEVKEYEAATFMTMVKYYIQAEKELEAQSWVHISIQYTDKSGIIHRLFTYDLPREVYERRSWVPEWRQAKFKCKFPRENVSCYFCYYDKRLGNDSKLNADFKRLIAAKAQVTRMQNKIEEYVKYERENNMFFDEDSDPNLMRARKKLEFKKSNIKAAEDRMKEKIKQIHPNN